ncbi:stress responsive alpha/beta barrel protein [Frondihabitans sp. PhB188]|uniref:Dabb family protein n=1 Tax=Frondihabitans sp. PhB188 TaxID=2485200 RepID=UPI000F4A5604|nr:Dabb family protein [Frondihabitans sp. PhB188]ROQ41574.1 stress responsive alpha/beta barrel protein [Frondihabitans sp. PhB188]
MIQHTVSFALVHPAGSAEEKDFLATAASILPTIAGVTDFGISRQVSAKSDLTWHFTMWFADQAAYAAYDSHPDHQNFVQTRWVTEVAAFQELDFEPVDVAAVAL